MITDVMKKATEGSRVNAKYEWEYGEFDDEIDPDSLSLSSHS